MAQICPSITATNLKDYRQQMLQIAPFAKRVHLDFMDGVLAPTRSPSLREVVLPKGVTVDMHLMYKKPAESLQDILRLKPHLVIVHAESSGNFAEFANALHKAGIKVGVALLQDTPVKIIKPGIEHIDHVLIFSGDLGHFGGIADASLLAKAQEAKELKPSLEIGWDGGINDQNAHLLAAGGIDVLNVGGFIQKASDPKAAYAKLKEQLGK